MVPFTQSTQNYMKSDGLPVRNMKEAQLGDEESKLIQMKSNDSIESDCESYVGIETWTNICFFATWKG